jgi:hypothetical protein
MINSLVENGKKRGEGIEGGKRMAEMDYNEGKKRRRR